VAGELLDRQGAAAGRPTGRTGVVVATQAAGAGRYRDPAATVLVPTGVPLVRPAV
jgi:hypothetical protein